MNSNKENRTISSILDLKTGKEIKSNDFFDADIDEIFRKRYEFESAIRDNNPRYVCYFCKQSVKIRGKREAKVIMHFAHLKDSKDCPIKTNNKFTKEEIQRIKYNGAKESELHFNLKQKIASYLKINQKNNKGIESVNIEKVYKDKAIPKVWKKPDISTVYFGVPIVFELQLSTTFLSVINSRQEFYKNNRTYILWIFNSFDTNDEKRKFTQSDIFYNNNYNGFEFNQEAIDLSLKENDLVLKCHYKKLDIENLTLIENWDSCMVKLQDLIFDTVNFSVYFYNYSKEKKDLENDLRIKRLISNSKLIEIVKSKNTYFEISKLFLDGYILDTEEKRYILKLYDEEIAKNRIIDQYNWQINIVYVTIFLKLNKIEFIERVSKNRQLQRIILDILSLKLDKILDYSFDNHKQIANMVLQSRKQYIDIFMKAVNIYRPTLFTLEDKKGKLTKILNEVLKEKPEQKIEDNEILYHMFSDIAQT